MRRVIYYLVSTVLMLTVAGYVGLWVIALSLRGRLAGVGQDLTTALLWLGGISLSIMIPVIFALPLLKGRN